MQNRRQIQQAIKQLKAFAKMHKLSGLDWKALRDKGRR
jgi:hypothetical protein